MKNPMARKLSPISHLVNMMGQLTVRAGDNGAACLRASNGGSNFFKLSSNPSGQYSKAVEQLIIRVVIDK